MTAAPALSRTLILEVALPDFNCDDYRVDAAAPDEIMAEVLREMAEVEGVEITPEWLAEHALEDSGLTTPRINLAILLGSKDGNFLERVKGQLVGARIVPRTPDHELADDDRLDDAEERDRGR